MDDNKNLFNNLNSQPNQDSNDISNSDNIKFNENDSATEQFSISNENPAENKEDAITYSYGKDYNYGKTFDNQTYSNQEYTSSWQSSQYQPQNDANNYNTPNQNTNTYSAYQNNTYTQSTPQDSGYSQQTSSSNKSEYKWNFNDYDKQNKAKYVSRKKRVIIACVAAFALLSISAIGSIFLFRSKSNIISEDPPSVSSLEATDNAINNNQTGLQINDNPQVQETLSATGALTTKQVYNKLAPSIISIQTYSPTSLDGKVLSEGSGIIINDEGYIITNAHVISAEVTPTVKVVLFNEESYEAKIIGQDAKTDLAVLKIEAEGLTPAEFGDSETIEIGDVAIAIGNPGGMRFSSSITQGIISGVNRQISDTNGYVMSCIQTDAAINPGNSGGALANQFGQVIGITSSKIAGEYYEGMGFAIPVHEAKPIIDDLIANGRVTGRPLIGIKYNPYEGIIDETMARFYNVPSGIIVMSVDTESDAYLKGVVTGDIIHKIDDTVITELSDITYALNDLKPGDEVSLTIFRRNTTTGPDMTGKELVISIKLMENPE